jgi:hypothetical protein
MARTQAAGGCPHPAASCAEPLLGNKFSDFYFKGTLEVGSDFSGNAAPNFAKQSLIP